MSDQRIPISQLSETQTAPDASYIAIDDGSLTKKITVENFNSTSTASAQQYANQAAASAQTVEDNIATSAAQIREATLAAREATQASTSATASATSAYDSASLAQNYSVNAATSAGQAMSAADTASQAITESRSHAQDSEAWAVGKRNGTDVPSSDVAYHNNAKYYSDNASSEADRAEAAADSINLPDPTLTIEGVAADSKATGNVFSILKNFMIVSDPVLISNVTAWIQGTIRESNGTNLDSTTRCRTSNMLQPKTVQGNLCVISVKDGYKVSYRAYSTTELASYDRSQSVTKFFEGTKDIYVVPNYYYRFVIAKVDDTNLTPEEVPEDALTIACYDQINKLLRNEMDDAISKIYKYIFTPEYNIISGGISPAGANIASDYRVRTQYFRITPGASYYMELTNSDYSFLNPCTYENNSQGTFKRNIQRLDGQHLLFTAEEGENYFRVGFFHVMRANSQAFTDEEKTALKDYVEMRSMTVKRCLERTGTYEFFTVDVERPLPFDDEAYTTETETIECVLRLPSSYTSAGKPTRLVFMAHGAHGYIEAADNHWYGTGWKKLCDDLLAAGYALFDTNVLSEGSKDPNEIGYAVGSPLYVNVVKKAYDYIQSNYNVYREIFCHGTSMGGTGATAFSHAYPKLVLAESSFAGRDVLRYIRAIMLGETDDRFARSYGYADLAELTADHFSHIVGISPSLSLKKVNSDGSITLPPDRETNYTEWIEYFGTLANHARADVVGKYIGSRSVPYKAWNSWTDNVGSTKLEEILKQAYTDGSACHYYIMNYETGTHDDMCFGQVNNMSAQLIAWYKRWE